MYRMYEVQSSLGWEIWGTFVENHVIHSKIQEAINPHLYNPMFYVLLKTSSTKIKFWYKYFNHISELYVSFSELLARPTNSLNIGYHLNKDTELRWNSKIKKGTEWSLNEIEIKLGQVLQGSFLKCTKFSISSMH